jgi:hypothetical protein
MKITDFPHVRAVLQQIDFAQLLTENDCHDAETLAVKISKTCQVHGKGNFEVLLALFLYLEQACADYCLNAGLKPKSRVA